MLACGCYVALLYIFTTTLHIPSVDIGVVLTKNVFRMLMPISFERLLPDTYNMEKIAKNPPHEERHGTPHIFDSVVLSASI